MGMLTSTPPHHRSPDLSAENDMSAESWSMDETALPSSRDLIPYPARQTSHIFFNASLHITVSISSAAANVDKNSYGLMKCRDRDV